MPNKLLALGAALAFALAAAAFAQGLPDSVRNVERIDGKVTVVSVDPATRRLAVRQETGETTSLDVPAEVRNLQNLKAGDVINLSYVLATEFVRAERGKATPDNALVAAEARAPEGVDLPAGGMVSKLTITGAVVGIDKANSTLTLVNPDGGKVRQFVVMSPEGRDMLARLKVGDRLTAHVTESLVIAATRDP